MREEPDAPEEQFTQARCRRARENNAGRTEHESVKSGDMRGGFDTLLSLPPGNAQHFRQGQKTTLPKAFRQGKRYSMDDPPVTIHAASEATKSAPV